MVSFAQVQADRRHSQSNILPDVYFRHLTGEEIQKLLKVIDKDGKHKDFPYILGFWMFENVFRDESGEKFIDINSA